MWFPNRSDTNRPVQAQKRARSLKFRVKVEEELYYPSSENKALISFAVTAKLICAFVFAYADCWFSHVVAQTLSEYCLMCAAYILTRLTGRPYAYKIDENINNV